ncbi:MAG TPA: hypothetical protein VKT80_10210, partial [Chloroflexota bacterium]|nr:hypothetical protein [Chloroflexota bacterium]
ASGYVSTSSWQPQQIVYDDHAIAVPSVAPDDLHLIEVGLYLPSTGQRVPVIDSNGAATGDLVKLDLAS